MNNRHSQVMKSYWEFGMLIEKLTAVAARVTNTCVGGCSNALGQLEQLAFYLNNFCLSLS